jgi:SNF2 family DNA or RNA helicase
MQAQISVTQSLKFIPKNFWSDKSFFEIQEIKRHSGKVMVKFLPFNEDTIRSQFNNAGLEIKTSLKQAVIENILSKENGIEREIYKRGKGFSAERAVQRALINCRKEVITEIALLSEQVSIKHNKLDTATQKSIVTTCTFSIKEPELQIEFSANKLQEIKVQFYFEISGMQIPLEAFYRNNYLLEYKDVYYFAANAAIDTLNFFKKIELTKYTNAFQLFYTEVVKKLDKSITIIDNNLFALDAIDVLPQPTVLISELSNTYLMLTPQFNYDGFILDGPFQEQVELTRNKISYNIVRNKEEEEKFTNYLIELHPSFNKQRQGYFYLSFADAKKKNWFINTYHTLLKDDVQVLGMDMLKHFRYSQYDAETVFTIKEQTQHIIQADLKVSFGKENIKLAELQKVLLANQRTLLLKDDSIGYLKDEWLNTYGVLLKNAKVHDKHISISSWVLLSMQHQQEKEEHSLKIMPGYAKEWQKEFLQWQKSTAPIYETPTAFQASLRTYQHKGFEWLVLLSKINAGACLADDMGLGKTIQTIAYLCWSNSETAKTKHLIVCPSSLLFNWQKELKAFAPHLQVCIANNEIKTDSLHIQADVYIVSFGFLRSKTEIFANHIWDTIVLDESHNIKNVNAQATKATKLLSSKFRIALSGTPVMNNTFDLYSQLNFLLPDLLGGQEHFRKQYANPIDRDKDEDKAVELRNIVAPYILRRTKTQIASDLPDKTVQTMWCEMGEEQRIFYNELQSTIKDNVLLDIKNNGIKNAQLQILAGITKLRQACILPELVKDFSGEHIASVKFEALLNQIEEKISENKVLIFSQFVGSLNKFSEILSAKGIAYFKFDGSTKPNERQALVDEFQNVSNETRIFLISLKAGNTGLTLTAADYVFLLDPWWNTAIQDQAIDRAHRIGQTKNVFAYKMICKDTIEEKILNIQIKKQKISEDLISTDDNMVKSLSEDDVAYLFSESKETVE